MGVHFGRCDFDRDRWELRRDGQLVALEPRAMRVLTELIDHRDRLVTKSELLDQVWGDRFVSEAALTTQIKALRRAVGDSGREQAVIRTVHGHGYRFVAEVAADVAVEVVADLPADVADTWVDGGPNDDRDGAVGTGSIARPVVAVLPFEDLSPDGSRAHLAGGLTSDVVAALAKHRWLRVVPCPSGAGSRTPNGAGRLEPDVEYAVEGTLRVSGDRVRVTVRLTDTSGVCRWTERYHRSSVDLFDVLDDIADVIVAAIEPEVGSAERERVTRGGGVDRRAWDLYHLGIAHFFRSTAADNAEAQRLLERARRLDPTFAEAHAWWAYAVVTGVTYWDTDADAAILDDALAATARALEADDHNAVFHMLRGRVQLARRDEDAALSASRWAVDLNPTLPAAYGALADASCAAGRYDDALTHAARAVELGSHDPQRWVFLTSGSLALLLSGRHDEAIEWSRRAAAVPSCQYWAIAHRIVALAHLGRFDEGHAAIGELVRMCPGFTVAYARTKLLARPDEVERYLDGLRLAGVDES